MTLDPLYQAIGWVLAQFYSVIPNLGVSIILLTIFIMLLLFPLTAKQAKSMIAMQKLAPEIKKLQAKYKGDRQKLNEETMKLYQENKVNPLASCLPLLLQLPIFFALFRVLRDMYKHVPKDSSLYRALCGPNHLAHCTAGNENHLTFLGIDLQKSAVDAHNGFGSALPYFILVGLVILTGYLQSRQAQKRTPAANKQMAMVTKVLPVFFGLISLQFPAGLVLYFFVSNLWRLGQQEVIFRRFQSATATGAKPAIKASPAAAKAVIDVDSRDSARNGKVAEAEVVDEVVDEEPEPEAPTPARAPKPEPGTRTTAARAAGSGTAARRGGGLRGLFSPPPPPDGNGASGSTAKPKPVKPGTPSKSVSKGSPAPRGSSAGTSGRPGQAGRRTSNKKRKRKR